jgi:hypothetical protein
MKLFLFSFLIILAGCSGSSNYSGLAVGQKFSKSQSFLNELKDSLISEYRSVKSKIGRQELLEKYHQRLEDYLIHHPMDSMKVTIDEVLVNGRTIRTKSHYSGIQFEYGLTFNGNMSPRIDSIYEFMKGLKEGSDTLVNFSYTGACQVNNPDSANLSAFKIYAFPVPPQYTGK